MGQSIGGEFRRRRKLELVAGGSQGLTDAQRDVLRSDAARVRYSRQLRQKLFGPAMFAETAWDILLTLYLAEGGLPRPRVQELAESTASPLSTTSRWLAYLQDEGLASVSGSNGPAHSPGVELTHKGRVLLDEYFLELREAEIMSAPQSGAEDPSRE